MMVWHTLTILVFCGGVQCSWNNEQIAFDLKFSDVHRLEWGVESKKKPNSELWCVRLSPKWGYVRTSLHTYDPNKLSSCRLLDSSAETLERRGCLLHVVKVKSSMCSIWSEVTESTWYYHITIKQRDGPGFIVETRPVNTEILDWCLILRSRHVSPVSKDQKVREI